MISDEEMARINIEASAALAQWIELMRADDSHFRKMVKVAQTLPMLQPLLDENTNNKLYRTISFINSPQSRQNFFAMLKEQYGDEWLEQKRADIMLNPARWLANGLINAYWRNKSGIEGIHAGEWEVRPLLHGALHPCKNTPLYRKLLRESCLACTQFIILSIRRAKTIGRSGSCRSRSIFHLQITGRFPHKQWKCCLKRLNRNCTLGAAKRFTLHKSDPFQSGRLESGLFGLANYL